MLTNWLKIFASIIGAVGLFIIIQQPESILNQKSSQETISRERAKLLLQIIREEDPELRKQSIEILKASYPSTDNEWINNIENYIDSKAKNEIAEELIKEYDRLQTKKEEYEEKLRSEIRGSSVSGYGPKARIIKSNIEIVDSKIDEVLEAFKIYDIPLDELKKEVE